MSNKQPQGELVIRTLCDRNTQNFQTGIFGGWIFGQMDIGATLIAKHETDNLVVTKAVNNLEFHNPAKLGNMLEIYAKLVRVGNSSIATYAEAWAVEIGTEEKVLVATAELVFVAIDKDYNPVKVGK